VKRYLLFCGHFYYPSGGWDDFSGDYDTIEEAKKHIEYEWNQIVDLETGEVFSEDGEEEWEPVSDEMKEKLTKELEEKGFISYKKEGEPLEGVFEDTK